MTRRPKSRLRENAFHRADSARNKIAIYSGVRRGLTDAGHALLGREHSGTHRHPQVELRCRRVDGETA